MNITKQAKHQDVSSKTTAGGGGEVFSFKSNNMQFFRADGMREATGYGEPKDWYFVVIKELFDNAIDWLRDNYRGANNARVTVRFNIDKQFTRINFKVRNSNPENKPVYAFTQLHNILNYNMTFGSKQNEFRATRGQLGDGLKRIMGLPFILMNLGEDDRNAFFNKQWDTPMYFRANGIERQASVKVNLGASEAINNIVESPQRLEHTDTEIEITLPILSNVISAVTPTKIERFCRLSISAVTDISFDIEISGPDPDIRADDLKTIFILNQHPISKTIHASTSVHAYYPVEFVTRIESVYDSDNTSVYQILRRFEEGAQMGKARFNKLLGVKDVDKYSLAEFMQRLDYQQKMLMLYRLLTGLAIEKEENAR